MNLCVICSRAHDGRGRTCSRPCTARLAANNRYDLKPEKVCEECGVRFRPRSYTRPGRFCSLACRSKFTAGRTFQHHDGYIYEAVATTDPLRIMATTAGSYAPQHRLVMARAIGRPLEAQESVHHVNGDRADNRLENLQLRIGKHGSGQAYCCADCGSHNLRPALLAA